jgi:hypothetical protein
LEFGRVGGIIGAEDARTGGMRRWICGISALLFACLATLGAVVISELHAEAGHPAAPTITYLWLWVGDAAIFAASVILLHFAVRQYRAN